MSDRTQWIIVGLAAAVVVGGIIFWKVVLPAKLDDSRRFAQEMAAVKAVSMVHTAETQYYSQYGKYATSLAQLGPPVSGSAGAGGADLIDPELATGEKAGFKFTLQPTQSGYELIAVPSQFGTSGSHTFFSDQSMAIHRHNGPEPATSSDPLIGQ